MAFAFWKSSSGDDAGKTTSVNALELVDMRGQVKAISRALADHRIQARRDDFDCQR